MVRDQTINIHIDTPQRANITTFDTNAIVPQAN
jgi:hypothetical protein